MHRLPHNFLKKIAEGLTEEETVLYVLALHYNNKKGLSYFKAEDRKRIRDILTTLTEDTKKHAGILELICELSEGGRHE